MNTVCTVITAPIKELALKLGKPETETNNLVGLWQSFNNDQRIPTVDELNKLSTELKHYRDTQIKFVLDDPVNKISKDFSPTQRFDRTEMLSRMFSEEVKKLLEFRIADAIDILNRAKANNAPFDVIYTLTKRLRSLQDNPVESRQQIIMDIGVENILTSIKKDIQKEISDSTDEYIKNGYQKVLDNFDYLMEGAFSAIEKNEGVRVFLDSNSVTRSADDKNLLESQLNDDEEGNRASGSEGYGYKVRTINSYNRLSKIVKNAISEVIRVDSNGIPEFDDLERLRYFNPEYVHAVLQGEMSELVITPDDFCIRDAEGEYTFPALEKAALKYPWINQIIRKLEDDPSLISAFYSNLREEFIHYWSTGFSTTQNRWGAFPENLPNVINSTQKETSVNYEQGITLDDNSIYGSDRRIIEDNADLGESITVDVLKELRDFSGTEDEITSISSKVSKLLKMVGINVAATPVSGMLQNEATKSNVETAVGYLRNIFEESKKLQPEEHLLLSLEEYYKPLYSLIGAISDFANNQTVRMGKERNSYSNYSYPTAVETIFKKFRSDDYRESELDLYKQDPWFYDKSKEGIEGENPWRNDILAAVADKNSAIRQNLTTSYQMYYEDKAYENWLPSEVRNVLITQYFSVPYDPNSTIQYARYHFPIMSDSTVAQFLKFRRYTGNYEEVLIPKLREVVKQELDRMKRIQDRRKVHATTISCFDKFGERFYFMPEFETLQYGETSIKEAIINAQKAGNTEEVNNIIDYGVKTVMENLFSEFMDNITDKNNKSISELLEFLHNDKSIVHAANGDIKVPLREYFWNDVYVQSQIIQVINTDLAYYKPNNGVDYQKRCKANMVSGIKLNTNSPNGKKAEKIIILKDFESPSTVYTLVKDVLNTGVKEGRLKSFDRDNILNKFKAVNQTDAQAFRTLPSLRSLLEMAGGQWTPTMERAYNNIVNGTFGMDDFLVIWQTLKPVKAGQVLKDDGIGGQMLVPQYHKNSESVLLSIYSTIAQASGKSSFIRGLNTFMVNNGIDVAQFESGVKVGAQGVIDLTHSEDKLQAYKDSPRWESIYNAAKEAMSEKDFRKASDYDIFLAGNMQLLENGKISQDILNRRIKNVQLSEQEVIDVLEEQTKENGEFRPDVVLELPYEMYSIQQPNPPHHLDAEVIIGSQFRNLLPVDIPDDPDFRITVRGKEYTKQEWLDIYNRCIIEDPLEDFFNLKKEFKDIKGVKKLLTSSIKNSGSYTRDLMDGIQLEQVINPYTNKPQEVFKVPLENLTNTEKIEQMVLSTFKSRISKQYIRGAACVQVSDVGFTDELKIVRNKKGGMEGLETYLPATSKDLFGPLLVTKKRADGTTYQELDINKLPYRIRRCIGIRIPTEDKCSIMPLIIKGFLPAQNGSSIMLPAEVTTIMGSDFDVDKLFLMIPEYKVIKYDYRKAEAYRKLEKDFVKVLQDKTQEERAKFLAEQESSEEQKINDSFDEQLEKMTSDEKESLNAWIEASVQEGDPYGLALENPIIKYINYDSTKLPHEQSSRAARHNMMLEFALGLLAHPETAQKILNPSNFDSLIIQSDLEKSITDAQTIRAFAKYLGIDEAVTAKDEFVIDLLVEKALDATKRADSSLFEDFLKDYSKTRNLLSPETFVHFHQQNMMGAATTGIFANNTAGQARFQTSKLEIAPHAAFNINGKRIHSFHEIYTEDGDRIIKNNSQYQAASVDNAKNPVLADSNINSNTASVAGILSRAGVSIEEVSLLLRQPAIAQIIKNTGDLQPKILENTTQRYIRLYDKWAKQIGIANLPEEASLTVLGKIQDYKFTSKELLKNIIIDRLSPNLTKIEEPTVDDLVRLTNTLKTLALFNLCINPTSTAINTLTLNTRADSPNGAADITIAGIQTQIHTLDAFHRMATKPDFALTGVSSVVKNRRLSPTMDKDEMRDAIMKTAVPRIQAFHSLGIELPLSLISDYFAQTSPYVNNLVQQLYDNSAYGTLPKELLNAFYKEFRMFAVLNTKAYGKDDNKTTVSKYNFYIKRFPEMFRRLKESNTAVRENPFIKRLEVKDGRISYIGGRDMSIPERESIQRDVSMMLHNDDPTLQTLAMMLWNYTLYTDSLKFDPRAMTAFFDTTFLTDMPSYINSLRWLKYDAKEGSLFDRFLPQFYANHLSSNRLLVPFIEYKENKMVFVGDTLEVNKLLVRNKNLTAQDLEEGKSESYLIISAIDPNNMKRGKIFYKLVQQTGMKCVYKEIKVLPNTNGTRTFYDPSLEMKEFIDTYSSVIMSEYKQPNNTINQRPSQFEYARTSNGRPNYEVSSRGDKRFSAMTATFAPGTVLFGHDVSGRTIESVYQHGVKQGDWTTDNNSKTGIPKDKTIIKGNTENDSYTQGYLPLWEEWAKQNPQLIEELRQKAQGKVITDMFASTAVSQARALADILNNTINQTQQTPGSIDSIQEGLNALEGGNTLPEDDYTSIAGDLNAFEQAPSETFDVSDQFAAMVEAQEAAWIRGEDVLEDYSEQEGLNELDTPLC